MNRHTPIPLNPSKGSNVTRAVVGLFREVIGIARALEHRRAIKSLAEFDDRTLKDIGLSRAEIDGALAEPLHRDPSLVLVRSVERRNRIRPLPEARPGRPVVPVVKDVRRA